jgi:hypothetical protein
MITDRINELMDELSSRINSEKKRSGFSVHTLAARSNLCRATITRSLIDGNMSTKTLLKIIDAMDCDIVFVRRAKLRTIFEIEGAEEQLFKFNNENNDNQKRFKGKQKSKREEFNAAERERDFLSD